MKKNMLPNKINHSFANIDTINRYRTKIGKIPKAHIFQKQTKKEPHFKIYKNGFIYKTISVDKLKIWMKLFKKGISVEQIKSINPNIQNEIKKEMDENKFKIKKGQTLVKSKSTGMPYKSTQNIITLEKLIKKSIKLPDSKKMSIVRQIVKITLQLAEEGYAHGHPHIGNWTIEFDKNKHPKVYLIDFKMIRSINESQNQHELLKDFQSIIKITQTILKDTNYNIETGKKLNHQAVTTFVKIIKKRRDRKT